MHNCQNVDEARFSTLRRPGWLVRLESLFGHILRDGVRWTFIQVVRIATRSLRRELRLAASRAGNLTVEIAGENLELQPGEWVQVRSEAEIRQTLDSQGNNRGLRFLPDMNAYCGATLIVYKRVQRIFLEESRQVRALKNTVMLSGAVCNGLEYGCDRSCLYYWREVWLRRVPPPPDHFVRGNDGR